MKKMLLLAALAFACTALFARPKDKVKKYVDDNEKTVIEHPEMECFDDMSDEAYLVWHEDGNTYSLVFRLKKQNVSGTKSMDILLNDDSVVKAKASVGDIEKRYNPILGCFVFTADIILPLDQTLLDNILNGQVKQFSFFVDGRGEEPYVWKRKRGKWDLDANFKHMYEHINQNK